MNYLAFVEGTLITINEITGDSAQAHRPMLPLHMLAARLVPAHMRSRVRSADSPLVRALGDVAEDLAAIGLARHTSSLFVSLTARGGLAATGGLSRERRSLADAVQLTPDALMFLRATRTVCEREDRHWAVLVRTDSDRILRQITEPWAPARLVYVWTELEEARAMTGVLIGGPPKILGLRPAYVGVVLATAGPGAKLQQLVRTLVEEREGATVDHKLRLDIASPAQKAEAARDIAAPANTQARGQR